MRSTIKTQDAGEGILLTAEILVVEDIRRFSVNLRNFSFYTRYWQKWNDTRESGATRLLHRSKTLAELIFVGGLLEAGANWQDQAQQKSVSGLLYSQQEDTSYHMGNMQSVGPPVNKGDYFSGNRAGNSYKPSMRKHLDNSDHQSGCR